MAKGHQDSRPERNGFGPFILPPGALRRLSGLLNSQAKSYRKKLKRCQEKFSEKSVHAARVQARRLLSAVELLAAFLPATRVRKVERLVKHQLDTFDDLRDTQVQLAAVKELARRFPDLRPFRAYLEKREARLTRPTRKKVKDLKPGRATKAIGACREELEAIRAKKSPEAAAALLQNSVRNAFERIRHLKERIDPRDSKTIHCTRVAFKKFRYMMESIAELTGSITKQRLSEMHDYQILMGDIQDSEVLLQSFDKFLCKKDLKPGAGRKFHCLLLERRELFIKKYLRHADRLYDFWPEKGKRTGKPNGASRARKTGKMPTHPTLIANPQPPKTRASSA